MAAALLDAALVTLLAVVTITDLRARVVPDAALIAAVAVALPICAIDDAGALPERALAAAGAGSFMLAGALVRPGGLGLGDVKLAAVLGLYLGGAVLGALLLAFIAGTIAGSAVIARHGWEARSRAIPFAPFLALGAVAVIADWVGATA